MAHFLRAHSPNGLTIQLGIPIQICIQLGIPILMGIDLGECILHLFVEPLHIYTILQLYANKFFHMAIHFPTTESVYLCIL